MFSMIKDSMVDGVRDGFGVDLPKHEKDRALAARIAGEEWAQREAVRVQYLAPDRWPVLINRIATRGQTQVEQVVAFLQQLGLSARPDLVYGVYRVPDRISQNVTPTSEAGRVVEWDVVHAGAPGTPDGTPLAATYFPAMEQWVARRSGEPSILDEDLGVVFLQWAGIPPERCLGIARYCNFSRPSDKWYAIDGGGGDGEGEYPIVPRVEGVLVFHHAAEGAGVPAQLAASAPLALGPEHLAGTHTEVLNWRAVARAVHPRLQHPPPTPSPFRYLPLTPQELLRAYLEVVGILPADCYSAQVTIDQPYSLVGRITAGTSNIGSTQPCADGKERHRLQGARRVVVTYRDRPEYAVGRDRWDRYQHEALLAHLERDTRARKPVEGDDLPNNSLLRFGAKALDLAEKVSSVGEWEEPPPCRYCWPPVG